MTALKDIIEKYGKMSNRELSDLYEYEIADLLPEARGELVAELKKRNIYAVQTENEIRTTETFTPSKDLSDLLYSFLESGWSRNMLKEYVLERGMNEDESTIVLDAICIKIKKKIKRASVSITNGILMGSIGLAIRSLPLNTEKYFGLIILCYCITALGTGKALHSYFLQRKLKKLESTLASCTYDSDAVA